MAKPKYYNALLYIMKYRFSKGKKVNIHPIAGHNISAGIIKSETPYIIAGSRHWEVVNGKDVYMISELHLRVSR